MVERVRFPSCFPVSAKIPAKTRRRLRGCKQLNSATVSRRGTRPMAAPHPSMTQIGNHVLKPKTLRLAYGYDPTVSEGAVKPPVFLTSTFVFGSADERRDFFDYVSGRKTPPA